MNRRLNRFVVPAVFAAAFVWWSCDEAQEPTPLAPQIEEVTPHYAVLPSGGGSGAIFTTTPDGSIVNENVHYQDKREVYLDGGPPGNAPQTAAGLDDGWYVFQITDPSGKVLLSMDRAKCRVVEIMDGIIQRRVTPEELGLTDGWGKKGANPCHIDDDPDGVAGASGQHDTNTDVDHGGDGAIVVQMMPYGTTPNPGGVYKAWMTPLQAYLNNGGELDEDPDEMNVGANKKLTHPCPDFCAAPDDGFGPPRRYVKTDNFKVEEAPPKIRIEKFEDLDGDGEYDEGEPWIGDGVCVVEQLDGSFQTTDDCSEPGAMGWPVEICEDTNSDGTFDDGDLDVACQTVYTPATFNAAFDVKFLLVEALPGNWYQSALFVNGTDENDEEQPTKPIIEIPMGGDDATVVFGNWQYSTKSGKKFEDLDADGSTDGDPGLGGWTIFVDYDGDGVFDADEPFAESSSDDATKGEYKITGIKPGTFYVREVDQDDWFCSFPNAGTETAPVKSEVCFYNHTFTSGSEFEENDFANWTYGSKSGKKYEDLDADGSIEGDPPLKDWKIFVDYDDDGEFDNGEPFGMTGEDGSYTIEKILPGTHTVREVLPGDWTCSYPNPGTPDAVTKVVESTNCSYTEEFKSRVEEVGNDFGNWDPVKKTGMKVSDVDFSDSYTSADQPMSGWTFFIDYDDDGELDEGEPSDVTDENGEFEIQGIVPGTWKVRELQKSGWICVFPGTTDDYGCYFEHTFRSGTDITEGNIFGNRATEGCTPGFWQGGTAGGEAGGRWLWNDDPTDPEWIASGGDVPPGNPYTHDDDFCTYFGGCSTAFDMWYYVNADSWPNASDDFNKAARSLVAAYLNASWGVAYSFTTTGLQSMWDKAVAGEMSYGELHAILDKANNAPGGCPISASGY